MDLLLAWLTAYGDIALFLLLALGIVGIPGPDEVLLLLAGYLAWLGRLGLPGVLAAGALGSMCGITVSYTLGRWIGLPLLARFGRFVHITEPQLTSVHDWIEEWGPASLLVVYFIPGLRHALAMAAGVAKLPWTRCGPFAYGGALAWSATFILLGYSLGDEAPRLLPWFHHSLWALGMLIGLTLGVLVLWRVRRNASTRRLTR